jgi:hypothetical protein
MVSRSNVTALLLLGLMASAPFLEGAAPAAPKASPAKQTDDGAVQLFLGPDSAEVVAGVKAALAGSRRFRTVDSSLQVKFKVPDLVPDAPIDVAWRDASVARTTARWLVLGSVRKEAAPVASASAQEGDAAPPPDAGAASPSVTYVVATRVLDLKVGDLGPVVSATGTGPEAIARELVKYLRVVNPLQGHVSAVKDNQVILDMGARDGVAPGTGFLIRRQTGTLAVPVATIRVVAVADWYAQCEVQDQARNTSPQRGDLAIEDTTDLLTSN